MEARGARAGADRAGARRTRRSSPTVSTGAPGRAYATLLIRKRWLSLSPETTTMATRTLTIDYPEDLLLSLKQSPEEFEIEARILLAVKLYEMSRISTGHAAEIAGMSR